MTVSRGKVEREAQRMVERCAAKPVLRLRLSRAAAFHDFPACPYGLDARAAFFLLEEFLGDPELRTDMVALSRGLERGMEPEASPRRRAEELLRGILKSTGLGARLKLDGEPEGFVCRDTGMWGLRAVLRTMSAAKLKSSLRGEALEEEFMGSAMASCFAVVSEASGAPVAAVFRDQDIKDCPFLYDDPEQAMALASQMERSELATGCSEAPAVKKAWL